MIDARIKIVQVESGNFSRQMNKEKIEDKIIDIYDEWHPNYGVPKITQKLREIGEKISEKTVGNYMI